MASVQSTKGQHIFWLDSACQNATPCQHVHGYFTDLPNITSYNNNNHKKIVKYKYNLKTLSSTKYKYWLTCLRLPRMPQELRQNNSWCGQLLCRHYWIPRALLGICCTHFHRDIFPCPWKACVHKNGPAQGVLEDLTYFLKFRDRSKVLFTKLHKFYFTIWQYQYDL